MTFCWLFVMLFPMTVSSDQLHIPFAAPVEHPLLGTVITTAGGTIRPKRKSPPFTAERLRHMSKIGKRLWQDPTFRSKMAEALKSVYQDPDWRARQRRAHIGMRHSDATRARMSVSQRRRYAKVEERKKVSDGLKRRYRNDPIAYAKMCEVQRRKWSRPEVRAKVSGENSCNWRGGASYEPYTPQWTDSLKQSIRERDHYTCQICGGEQGADAPVHHVNYDKKNCGSANLITLCVSCHTRTNPDRDYWTAALSMIQQTRQTNGGSQWE